MRDHRKQGTNLVSNSYYFFGIVNIIIEEGGLAPFGGIGKANFSYPRLARESGSAASIEGASPLRRLASPILLSPHNESFLQSSVCAYRAPRIKPPSERSQNPKTWGNWEGIGDFCLQKCQRGRQLSPLSEATRLDRSSRCSLRDYKKRGVAPYGDWLCQFAYHQKIKDSTIFSRILCFFYSSAKLAKRVLL